jgi:hypothetical protein
MRKNTFIIGFAAIALAMGRAVATPLKLQELIQ